VEPLLDVHGITAAVAAGLACLLNSNISEEKIAAFVDTGLAMDVVPFFVHIYCAYRAI
jgi:hypothetical protein